MITIKVGNKEYTFNHEIRLNELPEASNKEFYVGRVNHRMRELSYKFYYDADVEFLSMDNPETVHIYEQSLRYLIAMAFKNIYPKYKIKFKYSISRSIFCYVVNDDNPNIEEILTNLKVEMKRLVDLDLPFERVTMTTQEAVNFYIEQDYQDRIDIIEYRPENKVHFYICEGYMNYMYGYMVPSTGYLSKYLFRPYEIGFLIQYPRAETNKEIPVFKDAIQYVKTLRKASIWADVVEASTIADLNRHVEKNSIVEFDKAHNLWEVARFKEKHLVGIDEKLKELLKKKCRNISFFKKIKKSSKNFS